MEITITIGLWIIPTLITIATFGWAFWESYNESPGIGEGFTLLICGGCASFISLIAWLLYVIYDKISS